MLSIDNSSERARQIEKKWENAVVVDSLPKLRGLPREAELAKMLISEGGAVRYFERHADKQNNRGGFVELGATAKPTTRISLDSLVLGNAIVSDAARLDSSIVEGNAHVFECAWLQGVSVSGTDVKVYSNVADETIVNGSDFRVSFHGSTILSRQGMNVDLQTENVSYRISFKG